METELDSCTRNLYQPGARIKMLAAVPGVLDDKEAREELHKLWAGVIDKLLTRTALNTTFHYLFSKRGHIASYLYDYVPLLGWKR